MKGRLRSKTSDQIDQITVYTITFFCLDFFPLLLRNPMEILNRQMLQMGNKEFNISKPSFEYHFTDQKNQLGQNSTYKLKLYEHKLRQDLH